MKKYLISAVILVAMLTGCATSAERLERQAREAAMVKEALQNRRYTIDIHMMHPLRGRAVNVTSNYSVEVKGDTLVSYLPYFGRAYQVPYGGGKGLNFTAPITGYQSETDRKGTTRIMLTSENEENSYLYVLEVFSNGESSVEVQSRQRDRIYYTGRMNLWP